MALLPVFGYLLLRGLGAFLIAGDRIKPVDAIVVLGGGDDSRASQAAELMHQQYSKWMILTEPGEVKAGQGPGSQAVRSLAVEDGISPFAILVTEEISRSTRQEAQAVRKLMEKQGFQSVIVVTEPYHTQRTRLIFREVFRGSGFTMRVYPVQNHWYRSDTWFLSQEGWGHTLREYVKLVGFLLGR